jgi:choline dehydrogenase-like flavoprotein
MIIDARTVDEDEVLRTDVCIVGAGPAGIALARECIGEDFQVCLLESGGFEPDEALQSLSKGENVGLPYDRLDDARYRAFGGNSRTWSLDIGGGQPGIRLRALDPIDFEKRDWVPYSGWPFDRAHLEPFYERAHRFFQLGAVDYEPDHWEDPRTRPRLPFVGNRVTTTVFQFGRADLFTETYRDDINRAGNVTAYIYANVVELGTDTTGTLVERARVACLPGGTSVLMVSESGFQKVRVAPLPANRFSVAARIFVLAAGGTENARLLLLSHTVHAGGLGNQHDLVGRFFMEHPHIWSGHFISSTPGVPETTALYRIHSVAGVPVMAKLTLAEAVRRRERLLGYAVSIHPLKRSGRPASVHSLLRLGRALRERRRPRRLGLHLRNVITGIDQIAATVWGRATKRRRVGRATDYAVFRLDHMAEQAPNWNSRVTLSDQHDALGLPRVRLEWRLSPTDMRSMVRSQEIIDEELRRAGLGHLQIQLDEETPPVGLKGGWHHMGTTRMHVDPRQGVVDQHGKVHGVANLYVTGSSVFPTAGYANPTLTLCALAIRLADQVKREMRSTIRVHT